MGVLCFPEEPQGRTWSNRQTGERTGAGELRKPAAAQTVNSTLTWFICSTFTRILQSSVLVRKYLTLFKLLLHNMNLTDRTTFRIKLIYKNIVIYWFYLILIHSVN